LEGEGPTLGEDEQSMLVDENGMPIEGQPLPEDPNLVPGNDPEPLDDAFIDKALGRRGEEDGGKDEGIEPPQ
jgi:penicillin-binding protein 1A